MISRLLSILDEFIFILPITFISFTLHELAHGYVAYKLGDPTPKEEGRLTFNPVRHIDVFGLIVMFFLRFGWAKPMPVNPMFFKNPKRDMMFTSLAGPASNLIFAIISTFVSTILMYGYVITDSQVISFLLKFFYLLAMINFGLGIFNLIPVYPFDGSRILRYFMPNSFDDFIARYGTYIYIAFLLVVFLTNYVSTAISNVQKFCYEIFADILKYPAMFLANLIF